MIGDGHAMGVAAEVLQHILRATEGPFQVHHPVFSKQWPKPSSEDLGFAEELQLFGEAELTILEGLPEGGDELATEDLTQYRFGQEVVVRRVHPAGVIERETSGGHHTMDMGMKTCSNPPFASSGLTLWATAITTASGATPISCLMVRLVYWRVRSGYAAGSMATP